LRWQSKIIKKNWEERNWAVQRKLHVCCSYSETVINPLLGNGCYRQQAGKGLEVAAMIGKVQESVKRLQQIVVTVCKSPINPFINPYPVYGE
jgi:hypothetical protein